MKIIFDKKNDIYTTRLKRTVVHVKYDKEFWALHWQVLSQTIQCEESYFCHKLDCDLDDLKEKDMADDEYCHDCPRISSQCPDIDNHASDKWNENPQSLEEARQLILKRYENTVHNGLYKKNKDFYSIMYGSWIIN